MKWMKRIHSELGLCVKPISASDENCVVFILLVFPQMSHEFGKGMFGQIISIFTHAMTILI
jgi:hypothetical protein